MPVYFFSGKENYLKKQEISIEADAPTSQAPTYPVHALPIFSIKLQ